MQTLRNGRFILGIGTGWKEDEYLAYGYEFPKAPFRIAQLEELVLPKAGVFAHKEAEVLAHNLAVEITGQGTPQSFDGFGGCFIELGDGRAGYGEGNFYDPQAPDITLRPPARRWHWVKMLIEKYWLWRWFSGRSGGLHAIGDKILF